MRIRFWFRRKHKPTAGPDWGTGSTEYDDIYPDLFDDDAAPAWARHSTTAKGDMHMAGSAKTMEITIAADGGQGVYQTIRRAQSNIDQTDILAEAAQALSRKLTGISINNQRAVVAILTVASDSEEQAAELEDLVEEMAAGYGRAVKKTGKTTKVPADPMTRLDAVAAASEQTRDAVVLMLGSALGLAYSGPKQVTTALGNLGVPENLVEALLAAPGQAAPAETEPEPEEEGEPEIKDTVPLTRINNHAAKGKTEPVTA